MKKQLFTLLCLLCLSATVLAKDEIFIVGKVLEGTGLNSPISTATVKVFKASDNTLLATATSSISNSTMAAYT